MQTIAENLGVFAASLRYEDLPADVVHQAKRAIVDTLGCAIGGYANEPARIARDVAGLVTSSQPATIIFSGQKTSAELAAFANDVMVRHFDFNDGFIGAGSGHPSDSIAALLSAAEVAHAGGRELIVATVIAYEIFGRICDAWDNRAEGIDHSSYGGIASTAGVARLLGLAPRQISEAVNIFIAGNVALHQMRIGNISNWKSCGYANANRNAIFAAQLAARGMTGPSPIFEGRNGFFKIVSRKPLELAFGENGRPFRIMQSHIKRFPLGNFSQTVVTAIIEARALVNDIRDIARVHIHTSKKALDIMADSPEKWRPTSSESADHSIPYTAGVALMYGTVGRSYFREKYFLHDKALLELIGRIKCSASEEADRRDSEINLCDLELILRSGERKSVRAEFHRGHWRNPMSDAEIETKFRSLVENRLPAARVDALLKQLWNLEDLPEVGTLMQMTVKTSE